MYPLVPFVSFCGIWTLWRMSISLTKQYRILLWVGGLASVWFQHIQESIRQIERSWILYRPQIVLAEELEEKAPLERLLLVDNIPACWINRKPHERKLMSWFDVPVKPDDPKAFAQWLQKEKVWGVLWFREDWTQAPKIAPFLSSGTVWKEGEVVLRPVEQEKEYGWIFYRSNL